MNLLCREGSQPGGCLRDLARNLPLWWAFSWRPSVGTNRFVCLLGPCLESKFVWVFWKDHWIAIREDLYLIFLRQRYSATKNLGPWTSPYFQSVDVAFQLQGYRNRSDWKLGIYVSLWVSRWIKMDLIHLAARLTVDHGKRWPAFRSVPLCLCLQAVKRADNSDSVWEKVPRLLRWTVRKLGDRRSSLKNSSSSSSSCWILLVLCSAATMVRTFDTSHAL